MQERFTAVRAAEPTRASARHPEVRLDTSLELLMDRFPQIAASCVLATVVATAGSTYRKPGARMLIMPDGSYLGLLSGGCLEADLLDHALEVLESGAARAVEYDMRGPDDILFGIGAGCEGAMRILLEPAGPATRAWLALAAAANATRCGNPTPLIVLHQSAGMPLGTYHSDATLPGLLASAARQTLDEHASRNIDCEVDTHRTRAFVQFLAPAPHLLICGAGPDAQPVVHAARSLGWQVSVVDHRPAYATPERFPGARVVLADAKQLGSTVDLDRCHAVVVMSHHLISDAAYLRELAEAGVPAYVGLLGPEARRARIAAELGTLAEKLKFRLRGPVGIDIGAATPEGIALSIVAQIHSWLAGRRGSEPT